MEPFYPEVLTTKDVKKWNTLIGNIPQKDIYFTPEYANTIEKSFGYEAELFFYGNDENYIIHPFFKRKIDNLPFYDGNEVLYDISSPWFYGGPLSFITSKSKGKKLFKNFFIELHNYCEENNIVTEFTRLHPFIKNHLHVMNFIPIEKRWEIVYVDLTQDEKTLWNSFKKENRKAIRKAKGNNIEVFTTKKRKDIGEFYSIYSATMERKHADKFYFFSRDFFNQIFELLGDNAQLFVAVYNDRIIAGSILIGMGDFAHDYLRAAIPEFLNIRPNNLLVYNKILWAKENYYKFFSLQGGQSRSDGIFRFKLTFSESTLDFYTYAKVHNEKIYKILCEARDRFDRGSDKEIIETDYFPQYRR